MDNMDNTELTCGDLEHQVGERIDLARCEYAAAFARWMRAGHDVARPRGPRAQRPEHGGGVHRTGVMVGGQ